MSRLESISLFFMTYFLLINCNSRNNQLEENNSNIDTTSVIVVVPEDEIIKEALLIDSIKMHAFDDLYFDTRIGNSHNGEYSINGNDFKLYISLGSNSKNLNSEYLLKSNEFRTLDKTKAILKDVERTISIKYKKYKKLGQTNSIKHSEERGKVLDFDLRSFGKYSDKLIGYPYEYVGYKWDLTYKQIVIGYFIDYYLDDFRIALTSKRGIYYTVYIHIISKEVIYKIENNNKDRMKEDSEMF